MNLKSFFTSSLLLIAATTVSTVYASDSYVGANYSLLTYAESGFDDAKLNTVNLRIGTFFDRSFSGEIRLGTGLGDDSINYLGTDIDIEIDHFIGAYLRSGVLTTGNLYPYLVVGVTQGEVTAKALGANVSESETDLSFGIGIDYTIKNTVTVNAEYINYISKGLVDISGFTLGIAKRF